MMSSHPHAANDLECDDDRSTELTRLNENSSPNKFDAKLENRSGGSFFESIIHQYRIVYDSIVNFDFKSCNAKISGQSFMSSVVFAVISVAMVLANKAIPMVVTEEYRSHIPQITVVWFQCVVALICVEVAKFLKFVEYPPFSIDTAKQWLPVNLFFIAMICTGFFSIFYCSLPIVTVFKNLTNIITITCDVYIFNENVNRLTISAVAVMTVGAIMSSFHDLEFSMMGYFWMTMNLFATSGYILYMRYASTSIKLSKFGMVYYNNLLSVLILLPICYFKGELSTLLDPILMTPSFITVNFLAGFLGFLLNFASLWCVSTTSATTYSIIGTLNKVPITVLGFVVFNAQMTYEGKIYVAFATLGGFLFAYSKL